MSFFICGGTNYREDVNVGQFSFLPVEFKLGTSTITLLDSNGAFLEEQVKQYQDYTKKKY
jgi:hypothetical protein